MADSQSGRAEGAWRGVQDGFSAAFCTSSARSCSVAKKPAQEASTEPGSFDQRA